MGYLTEARFQELAQWVNAFSGGGDVHYFQIVGLRKDTEVGWGTVLTSNELKVRFEETLQAVVALDYRVQSGDISGREADAYMREAYPDYEWVGGHWSDFRASEVVEEVVDGSSTPSSDPDASSPTSAAEAVRAATPQAFSVGGAPGSVFIPTLEALPDEYDHALIQEALEDLADQVALNDAALAAGGINFPPGRVHGGAITPGTLPATAMEPVTWSTLLNQMPGPRGAIGLETKRSDTADRWVRSTANRGPGRMWDVASINFPSGWQPYRGVHRYRIINKTSRFTVMALLAAGPVVSGDVDFYPSWGYVINNIPHFLGRPPVGLQDIQYVGEAPVPFAYELVTGAWTNTARLFHDRAKVEYQDSTKTYGEALGTDEQLDPTADEIGACRGLAVSLVTGRTASEVYQQLNTRVHMNTIGLTSSGHGPSLSMPPGLEVQAPAPLTVMDWQYNDKKFIACDESVDLSTITNMVQGVPFSYEDCGKMVPDDEHFALVVQLDIQPEPRTTNFAHPVPSPDEWYEHGVRLDIDTDRVLELDVLVY
jgi:hypothetical protein